MRKTTVFTVVFRGEGEGGWSVASVWGKECRLRYRLFAASADERDHMFFGQILGLLFNIAGNGWPWGPAAIGCDSGDRNTVTAKMPVRALLVKMFGVIIHRQNEPGIRHCRSELRPFNEVPGAGNFLFHLIYPPRYEVTTIDVVLLSLYHICLKKSIVVL